MSSRSAEFRAEQIAYYEQREDRVYGPNLKRFLAKRLAAMRPYLSGSNSILEVACGRGWLARALKEENAEFPRRVVGVDLSYERVRMAHAMEILPAITDARDLPFKSDSFDAVVANEFLHHVHRDERDAVVREMVRVVRPAGVVLLVEPHRYHPLMIAAGLLMPADRGVFNFSISSTRESLLRATGQEPRVEPFNCFTYPTRPYSERLRPWIEGLEDMLENRITAASRLIVAWKREPKS